jgi:hypothetical protein
MGFSKGFDTFAPLGPCLVNSELIGDPAKLQLRTSVNGQVRQDETVQICCSGAVSHLLSFVRHDVAEGQYHYDRDSWR